MMINDNYYIAYSIKLFTTIDFAITKIKIFDQNTISISTTSKNIH